MLLFSVALAAPVVQVRRSMQRRMETEIGLVRRYQVAAEKRRGVKFPELHLAKAQYVVGGWNIEIRVANSSFAVMADTGSSNFAMALASCECGPGNTSLELGLLDAPISVQYGLGSWSGRETVAVSVGLSNLVVKTHLAGIESEDEFFGDFKGIVGLAYESIAAPYNTTPAVPLVQTFYEHGLIATDAVSFTFCSPIGVMSIGQVEDVVFVPNQKFFGEYAYYMVTVHSMMVKTAINADFNKYGGVVVDTGTTLIYLPEDAVAAIQDQLGLPRAFYDMDECLLSVFELPPIFFNLDNYTLVLHGDQYTWNFDNCFYWGIAVSDFPIIGNIAQNRRHVVFDKTRNRVGFADAPCFLEETMIAQPVPAAVAPFAGPAMLLVALTVVLAVYVSKARERHARLYGGYVPIPSSDDRRS